MGSPVARAPRVCVSLLAGFAGPRQLTDLRPRRGSEAVSECLPTVRLPLWRDGLGPRLRGVSVRLGA